MEELIRNEHITSSGLRFIIATNPNRSDGLIFVELAANSVVNENEILSIANISNRSGFLIIGVLFTASNELSLYNKSQCDVDLLIPTEPTRILFPIY